MAAVEICSSFIEDAPPGELFNVLDDVATFLPQEPDPLPLLRPALRKYGEEQFLTVKLPDSSQEVIFSSYNSLGNYRYYDVESSSSFVVWHTDLAVYDVEPYTLESSQSELIKSLLKVLSTHTKEHYPNASYGAYPIENDSAIAILIVANKYSPDNFWNGRWRSLYIYTPANSSLRGSIKVDVHYYEDGNVRLITNKPISTTLASSPSASDIGKHISSIERGYQEELNRAFSSLSQGAFKGLRRQLPITRQKVEWDKISAYRLGQEIGGGKPR